MTLSSFLFFTPDLQQLKHRARCSRDRAGQPTALPEWSDSQRPYPGQACRAGSIPLLLTSTKDAMSASSRSTPPHRLERAITGRNRPKRCVGNWFSVRLAPNSCSAFLAPLVAAIIVISDRSADKNAGDYCRVVVLRNPDKTISLTKHASKPYAFKCIWQLVSAVTRAGHF